MNTRNAILLLGVAASCAGMAQLHRTTRIEVEVTVVSIAGAPIQDAEVLLGLPRYGGGRKDAGVRGKTNKEGIVRLVGEAEQDYVIGVQCEGFYPHREPRRALVTPPEMEKYAKGLQRLRIELRPIVNPIVGIGRLIERRKIPAFGTDLGFDLFVGDWVTPHGSGTTTDFILRFSGHFNSVRDYDQSVLMRYPLAGDGILPIRVDYQHGSALHYPYEAPADGYAPEKTWRTWHTGTQAERGVDPHAAYIIRFRTELDEQGKVKRALYGVLGRDLQFGGDGRDGFTITFSYLLNPDWSRNIEFDAVKSFQNTKRN